MKTAIVRWVCGILLIAGSSLTASVEHFYEPPLEERLAISLEFRNLYDEIYDNGLDKDTAEARFRDLIGRLRSTFHNGEYCGEQLPDSSRFYYPLRGYTPSGSIGGRGSGYRAKGFDLFDINARGSHPAHDLFIRDRNQDDIDDWYCGPVDVVAFSNGMVLDMEPFWMEDSERRGGNYIWIYDPCLDGLFYYAHNSKVLVTPGQMIHAGEKIAEVGRTGFNAIKERSPTHLHFMYLRLNESGSPEPENPLKLLMASKTLSLFQTTAP